MTAPLKNNTLGATTISGSTSTSNYGFPSGSFTHKKESFMPSDQKAKLLAMHRDGKATAGIYVAVVLFVYFVLVILLLCRYGKRRRTTTEPPNLESRAEQGCLHVLNLQIDKTSPCVRDGCCKCIFRVFCCGQCTSRSNNLPAKPGTGNVDNEKETTIGNLKMTGSTNSQKNDQGQDKTDSTEEKVLKSDVDSNVDNLDKGQQFEMLTATHTGNVSQNHYDSDNEESTEED